MRLALPCKADVSQAFFAKRAEFIPSGIFGWVGPVGAGAIAHPSPAIEHYR
jgi:hypothetical protein